MENQVNEPVIRKRGRPAGKNRVPFTETKRRSQNAQLERERRRKMTNTFADLAAAVGIDGAISNSNLLEKVIAHLEQATQVNHSSEVESLTRCNDSLMAQIEKLEKQLAEPESEQSNFASREGFAASGTLKRKRAEAVSVLDRSPQGPCSMGRRPN